MRVCGQVIFLFYILSYSEINFLFAEWRKLSCSISSGIWVILLYVTACKKWWDEPWHPLNNKGDFCGQNYGTKTDEFFCVLRVCGKSAIFLSVLMGCSPPQQPHIERQEPFCLQNGFMKDKFLFVVYWRHMF